MPNPNLSNGTCYYGKNNQTKGDFVPCGNIVFGNWPCCALGDSCLGFDQANACYDQDCQCTPGYKSFPLVWWTTCISPSFGANCDC